MVTVQFSNDMAEAVSREVEAFLDWVAEQMKQADRPKKQGPRHTQAYVGLRTLQAKLDAHLKALEAPHAERTERNHRPTVRESRRFR